jgi:hypothetical protein
VTLAIFSLDEAAVRTSPYLELNLVDDILPVSVLTLRAARLFGFENQRFGSLKLSHFSLDQNKSLHARAFEAFDSTGRGAASYEM